MDAAVRSAITSVPTPAVVDITTTGRRTGEPRRKEVWLHFLDGTHYIMSRPGKPLSWYANLGADPALTVHVKEGATADIKAAATPVLAEGERREVIGLLVHRLGRGDEVEEWVRDSRLVRVRVDGF